MDCVYILKKQVEMQVQEVFMSIIDQDPRTGRHLQLLNKWFTSKENSTPSNIKEGFGNSALNCSWCNETSEKVEAAATDNLCLSLPLFALTLPLNLCMHWII